MDVTSNILGRRLLYIIIDNMKLVFFLTLMSILALSVVSEDEYRVRYFTKTSGI